MKARMEVKLDTTWTNQVIASVECELDNPHSPTARTLVELMTQRLKFMAEEIRHVNERAIPEVLGLAYDQELQRDRESRSIFADRQEQDD